MIKEIFNAVGWILKLIAKGLFYALKGIIWFLSNISMLTANCYKINKKSGFKTKKKEEIF